MIERLHLYLTANRAHLRLQTGVPRRPEIVPLESVDWDAGDPATLKLLGQAGRFLRTPLHVYVGSALCRLIVLDILDGIDDLTEKQAISLATMAHDLGISAADWVCAVDSPSADSKSVACAIRLSLLTRLNAMAMESRWRLASVRPLAGVLWNAVQLPDWTAADPRALLVVEEDAFSVIAASDHRINSVLALPHGGERGLVERERMRLAYSSLGGEVKDLRLGLAEGCRDMAVGSLSRHSLAANARQVYFADFRDMFFDVAAEAIA